MLSPPKPTVTQRYYRFISHTNMGTGQITQAMQLRDKAESNP